MKRTLKLTALLSLVSFSCVYGMETASSTPVVSTPVEAPKAVEAAVKTVAVSQEELVAAFKQGGREYAEQYSMKAYGMSLVELLKHNRINTAVYNMLTSKVVTAPVATMIKPAAEYVYDSVRHPKEHKVRSAIAYAFLGQAAYEAFKHRAELMQATKATGKSIWAATQATGKGIWTATQATGNGIVFATKATGNGIVSASKYVGGKIASVSCTVGNIGYYAIPGIDATHDAYTSIKAWWTKPAAPKA